MAVIQAESSPNFLTGSSEQSELARQKARSEELRLEERWNDLEKEINDWREKSKEAQAEGDYSSVGKCEIQIQKCRNLQEDLLEQAQTETPDYVEEFERNPPVDIASTDTGSPVEIYASTDTVSPSELPIDILETIQHFFA